jgi:hypothetical protein
LREGDHPNGGKLSDSLPSRGKVVPDDQASSRRIRRNQSKNDQSRERYFHGL